MRGRVEIDAREGLGEQDALRIALERIDVFPAERADDVTRLRLPPWRPDDVDVRGQLQETVASEAWTETHPKLLMREPIDKITVARIRRAT